MQKAQKQLDAVVAYISAHPETWTSDEVDDFKNIIQDVKELIDELIEIVREGYETAED